MLEESASAILPSSSLWSSMNSWFTPTVLFLLLNLVIGTIALTSSLQKKPTHQPHQQTQQQTEEQHIKIIRSPSVIQRLKSINFHSHFRSHEPQIPSTHITKQITDSDTLFDSLQNPQPQISEYFFESNNLEISENTPVSQNFVSDQTHQDNPKITQTHFDFDVDDFNEENEVKTMDEVYSHFVRTKSDTAPTAGEIPVKLPAKMRKSASSKSAFGHFEERDIVEARRPATVREAKVTDGDEEVDAKADDFINKFKQQLKLQRLDSIIRYKDMIGRGGGDGS